MSDINVNELTKQVMKRVISLQKKKYRSIEASVLVEGLLPIEEAVKSDYGVEEVFYNPFLLNKPGVREMLADLQASQGTLCYEVTGSELKQISTEVTPQGMVAVAKQRDYSIDDLQSNILVLDQLQDPGNVGTLFRIAHWFGLGGMLLMKGTVDVHNPKVVRSSMGSFFHLPFVYAEEIPETLMQGRTLFLSKAHGSETIRNIRLSEAEKFLLVIGNEARGIDPMFDEYEHRDLTLPPIGGAESLNAAVAAAAILSKLLY